MKEAGAIVVPPCVTDSPERLVPHAAVRHGTGRGLPGIDGGADAGCHGEHGRKPGSERGQPGRNALQDRADASHGTDTTIPP